MKNKLLLSLTIASSVILSGCQTLDPFTGEKKASSTTKGSAIGATIGAVVGYLSTKDKDRRDRQKAILAGAGVGALGGAAVGKYMDNQEDELRKKLAGSGVSVKRNGDELILNMPGNITFATGSSALNPEFNKVLDSVVIVLNEYDKTVIETAGYTDSVGSEESNQKLSEERAQSVGFYLLQKKVKSDRILTVGRGESNPIGDNWTEEGRQLNRRVELTLIPVTQEG